MKNEKRIGAGHKRPAPILLKETQGDDIMKFYQMTLLLLPITTKAISV